MKDLNEKQLEGAEKMVVNAGTVVFGMLIIGGFVASKGFQLTSVICGGIIYLILWWTVMKINAKRGSQK